MDKENGINILKSRDDNTPIFFRQAPDQEGQQADQQFVLADCHRCSWAKPDERFGPEKLRQRIEPWLTALCQSEHLSLLLGSGLSIAAHSLATGKQVPGMSIRSFGHFDSCIREAAKASAMSTGRGEGNLEDQLRVATDLLRGLEIVKSSKNEDKLLDLRQSIDTVLTAFAQSIFATEHNLATAAPRNREKAFNHLVSFLMSFASRTGTRERLHIFTTNYDRLIEAGAEAAGLHLLDRFVGSLAPVFRSSRLQLDIHYNPPGIRGEPRYLEGVARFTKLHGSVDWVDCDRTIRRLGIPFGADNLEPYLKVPGFESVDASHLMIFPNAAKDRETAAYPYVELFRDFAAAVCRPNHTLISFGYSFGDEHINRVIQDMLTIPSTHLVVISYDDPLGRIMRTYKALGRSAQISLFIGNHIGDFQTLVDNYLPKPAIDKTTFRMAELLKARWGSDPLRVPHVESQEDIEP